MKRILLKLVLGLILIYCPMKFSGQNPVISGNQLQISRIDYRNEGLSYMPDATRQQQVKNAMGKAMAFIRSISTKGGYVASYSDDLKKRYGEGYYELATSTEIYTQDPGTSAAGECFLRAYKVTGDEEYLAAAYEAGRALAWGQRSEGGWDHLVDVSHLYSHSKNPVRKSGDCTFDDNISQGALTFLIDLDEIIDADWLTESIELGLKFMLASQSENGAWPQWYPLLGSYHDYWTFNDSCINNCIKVMIKAHQVYKNDIYLESIKKAGNFIIMSQFKAPQSGWAQQYQHNLQPGWARKFEPAGVCSEVTASNIKMLADIYLYTKNDKYLSPIPAAIRWLEDSKIGENLWARIYEMGTNKPIYGNHDRRVHYVVSEGRTDYGMRGNFGINKRIDYCNYVLKTKTGYKKEILSQTDLNAKIDNMMKSVVKTIALLDDKGCWPDRGQGMIHLEDFISNMNLFCEYLELVEQKK
jgi:hypothetical protein